MLMSEVAFHVVAEKPGHLFQRKGTYLEIMLKNWDIALECDG